MNRRNFIEKTAVFGGLSTFNTFSFDKQQPQNRKKMAATIGHGEFKYKVNKEWIAPDAFKVKDCHEMVMDKKGRLILMTNETANNVIILDRSGNVLKTWGNEFPGGHGLSLNDEGGEEFLYITDHDRHQVYKTTLDGKKILTLDYPRETGVYEGAEKYKPTETAIASNGDIYVADGYGQSYIIQYNNKGEYIRHFAGFDENAKDDKINCSHGVCIDARDKDNPVLLVTSRTTQEFKRYTLDGKHIDTITTPGCWICRPVIKGENLFFAVIVTKSWYSYDGFVVVLDKNNNVISAPGGSEPVYKNDTLQEISYEDVFLNPHDVCIDNDDNIYVPQWYSGKTMPYKLERI